MYLLRILGFLALITITAALVMFVFTKNRRYLTFSKQAFKYTVIIALAVGAFFVLERFLMVI
jgi:hypothetical protein